MKKFIFGCLAVIVSLSLLGCDKITQLTEKINIREDMIRRIWWGIFNKSVSKT